ncbi:MAG TPA: tetratricopeptide repeat protein [Xenococcaceae cyanobacterium]
MLQLLQSLFDAKQENSIIPKSLRDQNPHSDIVASQTELADSLWQKGEIEQAIKLYKEEIQKNPDSEEIKLKLVKLLQQQYNISESYKKLATILKKQGQTEQAAEYYRQAIVIKSLIRSNNQKTTQRFLACDFDRSTVKEDLLDSAFSFVASLATNSQKIHQASNTSDPFFAAAQAARASSQTNIAWETVQLYVEQTLDAYDNLQWQETANSCRKILEIFPEMAEAYKILGNALQRMGDTAQAMQCYAQALKIQPDLAVVYAGIGKLYYQQQKWHKAKEYYQKASIINPRYPEAYYNLAEVWQQLDQPLKAEFCQQRAANIEAELSLTALSPTTQNNNNLLPEVTQTAQAIETCYELAQQSAKNHQWQEAAFYYRKALELNHIYPKTTINNQLSLNSAQLLANPNGSHSQLEKAIQRYRYQAELKPSSAKIQMALGNLYARNRQWQEAIASYRQVIKIEPRQAPAYLKLAQALAKVGQEAESTEQLYFAYTLKPELADADSLFNLGKAFVKQGDRQRAINCFSLAIDLKPNFFAAYHQLAATFGQLDRRQEAIECYHKAIAHNPEDTDAYFALGEQLTANHQWDSAVKAYRRVLELQPTYPQALSKLNHALSEKLKLNAVIKG